MGKKKKHVLFCQFKCVTSLNMLIYTLPSFVATVMVSVVLLAV